MRLIDAEYVSKRIPPEEIISRGVIAIAPTIEAEPRKHGRWILNRQGNWACSLCGNDPYHDNMKNMNYCPNCGADMRESTMGQVKPTEGVNEALRHALRADQTWAEYILKDERMDEVEDE